MVTATRELPEEAQLVATVYARAKLAAESLPDFGEFVFGWPCEEHHRLWARALDARRIKRLVITGPPSSAKTTWPGVIYTARQIAADPATHIAYLSYSEPVAQSRSVAIRDTFEEPELRMVYPKAIPDKHKGWGQGEWFLRRQNRSDPDPTLRAASVFGAVLAYHFNEIILDDPHDPEEAISKALREKVWRRLTDVLFPRLRPDARMVVTGFRWAEDDVPGRCMEQGSHLDDECNGKCEDHSSEGGDPPSEWHVAHTVAIKTAPDGTESSYWPGEWPIKKLYGIRRDVGASTFACQYQGLPAPDEGHIFKWWKRYKVLPRKDLVGIAIGVDAAYTEDERSDYTAWTAWGYDGKRQPWKYWLDAGRIKADMPTAEKHVGMFAQLIGKRFKGLPVRVFVRSRVAIDRIIAQHLRQQGVNAVEVKMPSGGDNIKQSLAKLIAPEFEAGRMMIPAEEIAPPSLDAWLHEHIMFPAGAHDDFVETTLVVGKRLAGTRVGVRRQDMRRLN